MGNSFQPEPGELTLFKSVGCRVQDAAIVEEGTIRVTDRRLYFRPFAGAACVIERPAILSVERGKFGFWPMTLVRCVDDVELALTAPDGWALGQAAMALVRPGMRDVGWVLKIGIRQSVAPCRKGGLVT